MLSRITLFLILASMLLASVAWRPIQTNGQAPAGCLAIYAATTRGGAEAPSGGGLSCNPSNASGGTSRVARVIDGDTIELANGDRVRYIGIDTPERGEPFFGNATRLNRSLVEGKRIRLMRDVSEKDRFGRLLRYVYVDDILVNAELVREGYARALEYEPDVRFFACFAALEQEALDQQRGMWAQ